MQRIESSANKKIKWLSSLKMKKVRLEENLFLIEGFKSVSEAVNGNAVIDMILFSDSFGYGIFTEFIDDSDIPAYVTNDWIFQKCSSQKTPEGVIAAVKKPNNTAESIIHSHKPVVILDKVNDPGNLGTIIRTADAFSFGGVLMLPGCADVYSPKTVQATMGSILRVDCCDINNEDMEMLSQEGYEIFGMHLDGSDMSKTRFTDAKTAVVIGSEAHGMSEDTAKICSGLLKIEMAGNAESLNASIAAGIIMHKLASELNF